MSSRMAPLQLDVVVVGAGVGGLAAAFALARTGHRVRVFDKLDATRPKRSVGVRIPPNLSKILYAWGLRDELSNATRCRKTGFHSMETNELLGILEWQEDVIKESGGDFLLMHYGDFYSMLYNLAVSAGATITFNTEIVSVSVAQAQDAPRAVLADGTVLTADLIIGADGSQSITRKAVTGQVEDDLPCGHSFFSIIVPVEKLRKDPDWSKWVDVHEPTWMGSGRSVSVYPIKSGQEYCAHAYWPHSHVKGDVPESWTTYCPTSVIDFEGTHPSIEHLFSMAPEALRSKYIVRPPLDEWVDESGTILLIGEAAHPLMPFTMHNASLAVEDAAVLGGLMSHLSTREQLPQILEAYQDIRLPRVKQVQETELNNAALVTHPDPQVQAMRNAALGQSLKQHGSDVHDQWSDELLSAQWEEVGALFGYDAIDVAEDWWIQWGALGEISREETSRPPFNFSFHVTQTVEEVA